MSITQATTNLRRKSTDLTSVMIFPAKRGHTGTVVSYVSNPSSLAMVTITSSRNICSLLEEKPKWANREYREAYMEAAVEQGVAWQIKINRTRRKMSQKMLAQALGTTQSAVSRMEDPEYGAHSLETLRQLAKIFDCALIVKFAGYSVLARESRRLSELDQYAPPFHHETGEFICP
jgi:transcriptional regulator with XRE-family HTH domain